MYIHDDAMCPGALALSPAPSVCPRPSESTADEQRPLA